MPHAEGDSSPVKSSDDESIQCSDVSEAGSDSHDSLSSQEGLEHELRSNDDKSIEENASKEVNTKPPETPQSNKPKVLPPMCIFLNANEVCFWFRC